MEEEDSHQLVVQDILLRIRIRSAIDCNSHESKRNSSNSEKTASDWMEDQVPTLGGALAYYTVFSLAPMLIIAIAIAGLVLGQEDAQGQILEQLRGLLGDESGKAMQTMVQGASAKPAAGVVATLIGVVTLLLVHQAFSRSNNRPVYCLPPFIRRSLYHPRLCLRASFFPLCSGLRRLVCF
jgi:uncharacterized BrkB/YihY/UPF0761 family membrane protein